MWPWLSDSLLMSRIWQKWCCLVLETRSEQALGLPPGTLLRTAHSTGSWLPRCEASQAALQSEPSVPEQSWKGSLKPADHTAPANIWLQTHETPCAQTIQLGRSHTPDRQELWDNNYCFQLFVFNWRMIALQYRVGFARHQMVFNNSSLRICKFKKILKFFLTH